MQGFATRRPVRSGLGRAPSQSYRPDFPPEIGGQFVPSGRLTNSAGKTSSAVANRSRARIVGLRVPRSSASASGARPTKHARKPGRTCSITSKCFTTRCESRSGTGCCRPSSSNGSRSWKRKAS